MSYSEIAVKLSIPKDRVKAALDTFGKVPAKHRNRIAFFGAGGQKQAGKIGSGISHRIVRMRGVTAKEREDIFDFVKKEDSSGQQIELLNTLVAGGLSVKEGLKELDKYVVKTIKLALRRTKFEKNSEAKTNFRKFVKKAINKYSKGLVV